MGRCYRLGLRAKTNGCDKLSGAFNRVEALSVKMSANEGFRLLLSVRCFRDEKLLLCDRSMVQSL